MDPSRPCPEIMKAPLLRPLLKQPRSGRRISRASTHVFPHKTHSPHPQSPTVRQQGAGAAQFARGRQLARKKKKEAHWP
eukprot:15430737-Alexandrium_andersonii.AAC.1